MQTQTWFITGASSGLGASIAEAALRAGHRVAGTARDNSRLTDLAAAYPRSVLPLSMDLTVPAEIEGAIAAAEDWSGGIDVLVNNAALGYMALIEEGEDQKIRTLFDTNVFGVTHTIRSVLPRMRARKRGSILNISSVNGVVAMPALGYYSATKFALEAISDALAQEVASLGIKVMSVEPGGIPTGIIGRNLRSPRAEGYGPEAHAILDALNGENSSALFVNDPDRIAELLVRLVTSGEFPQRLSVGADSWSLIMAKLEAQRAEYESWKDVSHSTSFA